MASPAFLFPGQGSESVGMGAALQAADPQLFDLWMARAEAASGRPIRRAVVSRGESELAGGDVAQPALLAVSLAMADSARSRGLRPRFVAGHGLGEYAAAVVAGVLDADDALQLAAERGRLMADAQRQQSGAMGVVLGLPADAVEYVCACVRQRLGYVTVAYINSPQQVVISGHASMVKAALEYAERQGGRTASLPIGAAFHSLLMAVVEAPLARRAVTMRWHDARVPLVSSVDGALLTSGPAIRVALIQRTTRCVDWSACMDTMVAGGCRHFLELGPGRVLTGLARQHSRDALAMGANGPAALEAFARRLASDQVDPRERLAA